MRKAIIVKKNHPFFGLIGLATSINSYGNIMFYPTNGNPYRTCVKGTDILICIKKSLLIF